MKALLDTNILIDYLNGLEQAREELNRHERLLVSLITWMEVMVGATTEEESPVRAFLSRFEMVPVSPEIAERAVDIRRRTGIRLPDAIIWASAQCEDALLVSRNRRDFPPDAPGVRMPYTL